MVLMMLNVSAASNRNIRLLSPRQGCHIFQKCFFFCCFLFCQSFCLFVNNVTQHIMNGLQWNFIEESTMGK